MPLQNQRCQHSGMKYSGPCETSMMELSAKMIIRYLLLTIFVYISIIINNSFSVDMKGTHNEFSI